LLDLIPQLDIDAELLSEESKRTYLGIIAKLQTEDDKNVS
jgi:hypothetical protein